MRFSFIIPVYNRPDEIYELLQSFLAQSDKEFEIVIIEDGSTEKSDKIVLKFIDQLNIIYLEKPNSGPGDSRNYGMQRASGDYFIILDSDCILPNFYFENVKKSLVKNYVDCFGGPDKALNSFSDIQKAINYAMTSFFTTGGIRGGNENIGKFQPRSFNMGLSKLAFNETKGFGTIHPGEDPDLTIRLWKKNFETKLISNAFVYHKRRINWNKFYNQVYKFGKARPILDSWHSEYSKLTFWFPTLFLFFALFAVLFTINLFFIPLIILIFYFGLIFVDSSFKNKSLKIGIFSVFATCIMFYSYGKGYLLSFIKIRILKKDPKVAFPELFFQKL